MYHEISFFYLARNKTSTSHYTDMPQRITKIILYVLLSILQLGGFSSFGQLVFDKKNYDFGDLYAYDYRHVDFHIKNTGNTVAYLLTVKKPIEIVYQISSSKIQPDSSIVLRIQVNQLKKGSFSYKIPVYLSAANDPVELIVHGTIKEPIQQGGGDFTSCPDFNQRPSDGNPMDFKLKIVTIDEATKEVIPNTQVVMLQNGTPIGKWQTNYNGVIEQQVPLGLSYFFAKHPTYEATELGAYVNIQRNYIVIPLRKKVTLPEEQENVILIEEAPANDNADSVEIVDQLLEFLIATDSQKDRENKEEQTPSPLETIARNNFDASLFKPINVVFVIDVSSSMNQADRLELMKFSLLELADMLRPQDRISLVAYATNARVLLPSVSGSEKETIKTHVKELKASGLTAGGEGIKLGFKQARKNFISEGENHVIIITDGGFNRASGDYKKVIQKNLEKGVTLSVVGIKNNEKAAANMREAASFGNGNYIPIHGLIDAKENLREEIRKRTFILR
jgi:Ca-activated chloride channel family protein